MQGTQVNAGEPWMPRECRELRELNERRDLAASARTCRYLGALTVACALVQLGLALI